MPQYTVDSPAKKQSKWSAEEDALIIELRGSGMKWEDISKRLPGRSAISCRLHYQNYLERRSEWDEERKNKLARLYERFKPEMWAKVAEEMHIPWRAAEAMHWQLGEADMAQRAGVTPFSLTATAVDTSSSSHYHHRSPSHTPYQHQSQHQHQHQHLHQQAHTHRHSQGGMRGDAGSVGGGIGSGTPSPRYGRGGNPSVGLPPPPPASMLSDRPIPGLAQRTFGGPGGRQERSGILGRGIGAGGPSDPSNNMYHYQQQPQQQYHHVGPGLPPIQTGGPAPPLQQERVGGSGALPSLAEITTGVAPYNTPAYSLGASPAASTAESSVPGSGHPMYSSGHGGPVRGPDPSGMAGKRRASPNFEPRDQRRRYIPSPQYDEGRGGYHR